jgi:fluoroquinolone transport system ATP-binding protein
MIQVEDLSFTYDRAEKPAVRGLGFGIERGEIFGFLGPNGAGKSTTQRILIRLLRDYTGGVSVLGRDLRTWRSDFFERVGVSFEFPNHYQKLTALENLRYFSALYQGETRPPEELLESVDLGADGGTLVSQYSKGMKNRLSIARALVNNPELIFMDEPTAGLDPLSARRIKELIKSQQTAGKTIFLTTHDMTVADELCDRVAFIVDGEIRLIDAPRELKLRYGEPRVRVEYSESGETRYREFPLGGLADQDGFLDVLRSHEIQTIHTLEATLEEIFIRVTGRELR